MEVKTETELTYWLGMTETQAQDLLNLATTIDGGRVAKETLNELRQALLDAGLTRTEDPD